MRCPRCQHDNPAEARFCNECGALLEAKTQEKVPAAYYDAGFGVRLGAWLIDAIVMVVTSLILVHFASYWGAVACVITYVGLTAWRGQTPGKMLSGIRVITEDGQPPGLLRALLREVVGKALCALPFLLGFLFIASDPRKRGWHDYLAGTYVIHLARCPACGATKTSDWSVCPKCGHALPALSRERYTGPAEEATPPQVQRQPSESGSGPDSRAWVRQESLTPRQVAPAPVLTCTACGGMSTGANDFCINCGSRIVVSLDEWPFGAGAPRSNNPL